MSFVSILGLFKEVIELARTVFDFIPFIKNKKSKKFETKFSLKGEFFNIKQIKFSDENKKNSFTKPKSKLDQYVDNTELKLNKLDNSCSLEGTYILHKNGKFEMSGIMKAKGIYSKGSYSMAYTIHDKKTQETLWCGVIILRHEEWGGFFGYLLSRVHDQGTSERIGISYAMLKQIST